jgi:hypothetical protein
VAAMRASSLSRPRTEAAPAGPMQGCSKLDLANASKIPCRIDADPAVVVLLVVVIVIENPGEEIDYEDEDDDEDDSLSPKRPFQERVK